MNNEEIQEQKRLALAAKVVALAAEDRGPVAAGTIDRWGFKPMSIGIQPVDDGEYILYAAHLADKAAAVAEAQARANNVIANCVAYTNELEAKLRAATAPVSAAPADERVIETLRSIACQSVGSDWTHEQAFTYCREAAKMAIASLPSAGAPVSAAEQAGGQELPALIDDLLLSWNTRGPDTPEVCRRRVDARAALESAIKAALAMRQPQGVDIRCNVLKDVMAMLDTAGQNGAYGIVYDMYIETVAAKQAGKEGAT